MSCPKEEQRIREQILRTLFAAPKSFWEVIRDQDGDLARYTRLINELMQAGIIRHKNGVLSLTEQGQALATNEGIRPLKKLLCPTCQGKTVVVNDTFAAVLKEFSEIATRRPAAIPEYDQGYIDPQSTVARAAIMYLRGDLENQEIFVLGDDDLTSIAIALTGMAKRVVVLEIDKRLVDFINEFAARRNLGNLSAWEYDIRNPLPKEFQGQFDTFVIDPVETLPGIRLFLTRCCQALKGKGCAGYLGLTHLEASREKWHQIQKMILEMNFVITEIIHDFQEYELEREGFVQKNYPLVQHVAVPLPPPKMNWYTSNFVRLEAIATPQAPADSEVPWGREFYFDEEAYATLP